MGGSYTWTVGRSHLQHGGYVHTNLPELLLVIIGNVFRMQGQQTKGTTTILEVIDQLQEKGYTSS